jgi:hypothetical protein
VGDGGVGEEDCGVDEGFHGCFPRCIGVGWGWLGSWLGLVCGLVGLCFLGSPSPLLRAGKRIFTGVF